jgi:monoamine oxidase
MRYDVTVLGAGLAGLSAARDLAAAGADVVVLEARHRAGGRVEQAELADGRLVQLGGEVVGEFHTSYRELVGELGLTLGPAFPGLPGSDTHALHDGKYVIDDFGWLSPDDRASYLAVEDQFCRLARSVNPSNPWAHPDAKALDALSVAEWMRSAGATRNAIRAREVAMLALAAESPERTSLLADLRKESEAGSTGFYNYDVWESQRVEQGSATVALRMAAELGHRIRYATPARAVHIGATGCLTVSASGETFRSDAVVSSLPAGPLRDLEIAGVSDERLRSLRAQRHAIVAKVVLAYPTSFWEANGQNGSGYSEEGLIGGTWSQRNGIMSALVPPERYGPFLATAASDLQHQLIDEVAGLFGPQAQTPEAFYVRRWGTDPWTQGYITAWRPGDVMKVGPQHGTHEPPFFVCGSDQWVCGYMEGAVRTGRAAAAAVAASTACVAIP